MIKGTFVLVYHLNEGHPICYNKTIRTSSSESVELISLEEKTQNKIQTNKT